MATETRICALPGCTVTFHPMRSWQKTCCKEHSRRLRYVRRRDRLMVKRMMVTNRDEVMEILREGDGHAHT